MNPRVIMHPGNLQGRDFIVGDLHGHPDVLYQLMDQVGFDVDTDRLFSVGDLVDRGPNSAAALDLLDAPWFYPVLGNHDAIPRWSHILPAACGFMITAARWTRCRPTIGHPYFWK